MNDQDDFKGLVEYYDDMRREGKTTREIVSFVYKYFNLNGEELNRHIMAVAMSMRKCGIRRYRDIPPIDNMLKKMK